MKNNTHLCLTYSLDIILPNIFNFFYKFLLMLYDNIYVTCILMFPVANSASNKKCGTSYKRDNWDFFNCYRCANLNATWISLQW